MAETAKVSSRAGGNDPDSVIVRRRYHLHTPGVTYALTTCVLIFGAINGQNNLLFLIFGLAVGGLLISGIISGAALMGLRVRREIDLRGEVGGEIEIRYLVSNRNRFLPAFAVVIDEVRADRDDLKVKIRRLWARLIRRPVPGDERSVRGWWSLIGNPRAVATYIPARSTVVVRVRVPCVARGAAELEGFLASTTFPFGLTKKSVTFSQRAGFLIRPKAIAVDAKALNGAMGEADRSRSNITRRDGDEFHGLREYSPGDSVRSVAWRASARSEGLRVRTATPRTERSIEIYVDMNGASPEQAEHARSVAAGIIDLAARSRWRVGLVNGEGRAVTPFGSTREVAGIALDALAMDELPEAALVSGPGAPARTSVVTVQARAVGVETTSPLLMHAARDRRGVSA